MSAPDSNPSLQISGKFTDGLSSRSLAVLVEVTPALVLLWDAETKTLLSEWSRSDLVIRSFAENVTRISLKDNPESSVLIEASADKIFGHSHFKRPLWQRLTFYLAGLVVAFYGIQAIVPPLSRILAKKVPIEWEEKISTGYATHFLKNVCKSSEMNDSVNAIVIRLQNGMSPRVPYRVVIAADDFDNAFAFPGGLIVIGRTLIEKSTSPEEIAGVLAHEIQHVEQRHVIAGLIRASMLTALWSLAVGDYSGLLIVDPTVALQIASLQFSRSDEASADEGALASLDQAGISREGYAKFFARMAAPDPAEQKPQNASMPTISEVPEMLSSHPSHQSRIDLIMSKKTITTLPIIPAVLDWNKIKMDCSG